MPSTLKNESRQAVVIVLDHPAFQTKAHGWQRTSAAFASQAEDGARSVAEVRRSYPGTLTLQPGEEAAGLPDAIEHCSQVPGLKKSRVLSIRREKPSTAQEEAES